MSSLRTFTLRWIDSTFKLFVRFPRQGLLVHLGCLQQLAGASKQASRAQSGRVRNKVLDSFDSRARSVKVGDIDSFGC